MQKPMDTMGQMERGITLTLKKCFFILHFNGFDEKKYQRYQREFFFQDFKALLPDSNGSHDDNNTECVNHRLFYSFHKIYCTIQPCNP